MKNDPGKWTQQMWVIPGEARLEREADEWFISIFSGIKIRISPYTGEKLSNWIVAKHLQQSLLDNDDTLKPT